VVVASFLRLVPKKVDLLVVLEVSEAVSLVPTRWKHIEADLSPYRVFESVVRELLLEGADECLPNAVMVVILFELVPLLLGTVAAYRRDIDETSAILQESASLDGNVEVSDVSQAEVDEGLKPLFSHEVLDGLNAPTATSLPISSLPLYAISPFSLKK